MNDDEQAILIADDDVNIRTLLARLLASDEHDKRVLLARDGVEAMEILASRRIGIVLLDLMMPRASGLDVIEFLRAMPSPPPVIIITAFSSRQSDPELQEPFIKAVVSKPFDLTYLRRSVENGLGRSLEGDIRRMEH